SHHRGLGAASRRPLKQLPKRLDAVKDARGGLTHYGGFAGSHHQDVAFLFGLGRQAQPRLAQNAPASLAFGACQHNAGPTSSLRSHAGGNTTQRIQLLSEKRSGKAVFLLVACNLDTDARPHPEYSLTRFKLVWVRGEREAGREKGRTGKHQSKQ